MALNEPRTIPYDFHVFAAAGWVWLYDDSARSYPCTATPHVYAEPLYPVDGDALDAYDYPPDPCYFAVPRFVEAGPAVPGAVSLDYPIPADVSPSDAYDEAREEACGDCRI